jgi:hypothetical protein
MINLLLHFNLTTPAKKNIVGIYSYLLLWISQ